MPLHRAVLRGAALLVPAPQRGEWRAEWRAELCYVPAGLRTSFCMGAFQDAFWLRRNNPAPIIYLQSPWQCLGVLAILAALSLFFANRLPLVREILLPPPYADARSLVTMSAVPATEYRLLAQDVPRGPFSQIAFYRPIRTSVVPRRYGLVIAMASRNLFELLGIPVAVSQNPAVNALILTTNAWRRYFDQTPNIIGRPVNIGSQPAQITAVVSDSVWRLPGRVDGWLLVDDQHLSTLSESARGFVLARPSSFTKHISIRNEEGAFDRFDCVAVPESRPLLAFLLLSLVACVLLPSVTSLSLGEYPVNHHALSRATKMRRWIFLGVKAALVLPIVLLGTLDLFSLIAVNLMAHCVMVGTVAGFRWVLVDQRRRCPICLRVLSNPTVIGQPSHTFLDWYGTELVCSRGHGLLHVPEIANSYSTQRWLHLDSSWRSLFS